MGDLKHKTQSNWKENNYETITYYSKEAEDLKEMEKELMKGIYKNTNFNKIMDRVEIAQDRKLKKRKRIKIGRLEDKYIKSAAWMTEEIIISQKIRKIMSAKWREARKLNKSEEEIRNLEKDYKVRQIITSKMIGRTKGEWERRRIEEATESNGKSMWKLIKEVLGNRESKNNEVYIYKNSKERTKIEDIWNPFVDAWKVNLYQKQKRILKEKWYGTKEEEGFKKEIIKEEEELGDRSRMMKMPEMTKEDFRRIVNNQKNGKAAGTDNIKTEVIKHLIKNEEFAEITSDAINGIYKRKIHRRLKETRTTMLKKKPKPEIMDWRPIAVGGVMSKTICTLYREK